VQLWDLEVHPYQVHFHIDGDSEMHLDQGVSSEPWASKTPWQWPSERSVGSAGWTGGRSFAGVQTSRDAARVILP